MRLFEVVITTKYDEDDNPDPKVLLDTKLFAMNEMSAGMKAMALMKDEDVNPDDVDVHLRPF